MIGGWFLVLVFLVDYGSGLNNACTTWPSYYNIILSPNCFYEPDVLSTAPEILDRHVGAKNWENYTVTTEDGYILTMFRIKRENRRGVIMLQHPITVDGSIWIGQSQNSTAFLLWDLGYEVWIPNQRGTFYSEKHVNLSSSDYEYWNFTFHEIGLYDYPKFIEKIHEVTKSNDIAYLGHSMSGTAGLILSSLKPEFMKKYIKVMILMAPAAIFKNVRSPAKLLVPFAPLLEKITRDLKWGGLFTPNSIESAIARLLIFSPSKTLFEWAINLFTGGTELQFDPALINIALTVAPRGFSWKSVFHYIQFVKSGGKFQYYDYGKDKNQQLYNSTTPPEYPLENIQIPIFQVSSSADSLTTLKDAQLLYEKLPEVTKTYGNLTISRINHVNYQYGIDRIEIVYSKLFSLLNSLYKE